MVARYTALTVLGVIFAFPFYWMFVTSVEPVSRLSDVPPNVLPLWDWGTYNDAWNAAPWGRYFANSIFIAAAATSLTLGTSLLAGYALASLRFPGKSVVFLIVLMVLFIPDEVILIPQYLILDNLRTWVFFGDVGWLNTYQALIVPFGASPFGIFLLRQFFLTLPRDLWDAAQLDGCGRTSYLSRVAAPLARPALAALAIYSFLSMWNQFLYPLVIAGLDPNVQPIQVGLAGFLGVHSVEWSRLAAASVFTTLPVLVIFLLAQRQIIEGVAAGGIGGIEK